MTSDARKLFDAFVRQQPTSRVDSFESWLGKNCGQVIGIDLSQVDAFVEANKRRLWNYIKTSMRELRQACERDLVEVVDEDRMLFLNLQFDLLTSPKSSRELKLGYRWALFNFVDQLTWRQYEALAFVSANLFGAENVTLTPGGSEGGVDLYAVIPNKGQTRIFHGRHAYYKIVGQSKRYTSPLDVGRTREFIHVVNAVRNRSEEITPKIPVWFNDYDGPVIGWINSHAGFQSGSVDIAKIHGVMISDTIKLCDSLLSVRSTPSIKTPNELRDFFSAKISAALQ